MQSLCASKRYDASLFFGHIVLEKILKALVVQRTGDHAPYTHNLVQLAEVSGATFSADEMMFLQEANTFNMEARYPEAKLRFYKQCTEDFTRPKIEKIEQLYDRICHELKQSK